jgi:hypothetical protein
VAAALVVALAAGYGGRWWHIHPPYGPEAPAVESSVHFVSEADSESIAGHGLHGPGRSGVLVPAAPGLSGHSNSFHCPSETTRTAPSTTLMAVSSSIA